MSQLSRLHIILYFNLVFLYGVNNYKDMVFLNNSVMMQHHPLNCIPTNNNTSCKTVLQTNKQGVSAPPSPQVQCEPCGRVPVCCDWLARWLPSGYTYPRHTPLAWGRCVVQSWRRGMRTCRIFSAPTREGQNWHVPPYAPRSVAPRMKWISHPWVWVFVVQRILVNITFVCVGGGGGCLAIIRIPCDVKSTLSGDTRLVSEGVDVFRFVFVERAGVSGCSGELFSDVADGRRPDVGRGCPEDERRDPRHPASASHRLILLFFFLLLLESSCCRGAADGGWE